MEVWQGFGWEEQVCQLVIKFKIHMKNRFPKPGKLNMEKLIWISN